MPTVCTFCGIKITFNWYEGKHKGAHFHAEYGGQGASFSIPDFNILAGSLPPNVVKMIKEWANAHKDELIKNWELVSKQKQPNKISSRRK